MLNEIIWDVEHTVFTLHKHHTLFHLYDCRHLLLLLPGEAWGFHKLPYCFRSLFFFLFNFIFYHQSSIFFLIILHCALEYCSLVFPTFVIIFSSLAGFWPHFHFPLILPVISSCPVLLQTSGWRRGGSVVKVLCYKSDGCWFDPSWCHWNFSLT